MPHQAEVDAGGRFEFGRNWSRFLQTLNDRRISEAEASLQSMLGLETLQGLRFIDVGCGSGLFSLAARRLGASVHSFDYDPHSVACAEELRRRYFPGDPGWTVEQASVLDQEYLRRQGQFDIAYSWGVLHHTGQMWRALENVAPLVNQGGRLFIAIYNDQGSASRRWWKIKRLYNSRPLFRPFLSVGCLFFLYWRDMVKDLLALKPFRFWRLYGKERGMSLWTDLVDWVGGYPFEVARPEQLLDFYRSRGFTLIKMKTVNSLGCNELVFQKTGA